MKSNMKQIIFRFLSFLVLFFAFQTVKSQSLAEQVTGTYSGNYLQWMEGEQFLTENYNYYIEAISSDEIEITDDYGITFTGTLSTIDDTEIKLTIPTQSTSFEGFSTGTYEGLYWENIMHLSEEEGLHGVFNANSNSLKLGMTIEGVVVTFEGNQ